MHGNIYNFKYLVMSVLLGLLMSGCAGEPLYYWHTEGCTEADTDYINIKMQTWIVGLKRIRIVKTKDIGSTFYCAYSKSQFKTIAPQDCQADNILACAQTGGSIWFHFDETRSMWVGNKHNIVLHEIGHWLGLGHSDNTDDIMFLKAGGPDRQLTLDNFALVEGRHYLKKDR